MDWDWKAVRLPLLVELPGLLIQVTAIAALLFLTYGNLTLSLFATILSLIWLRSKPASTDQILEWRARRELFGKLGEWLGREDARREFDDAMESARLVDEGQSIEDSLFSDSALSQAIVGFTRGAVAILLNIYLGALILWAVWRHAGV